MPDSKLKVSAVLSIHNRSRLFHRALYGYLSQTMPASDWEIVLVDDMSTEDLSEAYKPFLGALNLRHIKMDHRKNVVWKQRNPNGTTDAFENWYHTPCLALNLGFYLARGSVICLCHPEILHAPQNFAYAYLKLIEKKEKNYLFGTTYLGTLSMNKWLNEHQNWTSLGWYGFLTQVNHIEPLTCFKPNELYWYTSFLTKEAVEKVGGCDWDYLHGAAGEDDDFKERVSLAGWPPTRVHEIQGFHQDHSDEKEKHRQRNTKFWEDGLARNRKTFTLRKTISGFPIPANPGFDWTAKECLVSETSYVVGKKEPDAVREG